MRRATARLASTVALAGVLGVVSTAHAQQPTPKSQLAAVTQQIAGAKIEVVYRRPVARGRALFGSLVPWGRIWTPSADSAARITISAPITVNGAALAAGTYSIWTIPDSVSWTVVFNSTPAAFHLRYPADTDVLRVQAAPQKGPHVETLMFAFHSVDGDSATLQMHWGTTIVPLTIRVAPDASH
jgi:NAD(P)H-dependent flavin oxidoreductase YrpB (nitropropane dioxygenase family)